MSFRDGKPFVATEKHTQASWLGGKNGIYFRCHLCGYKFKAGDVVRWQHTNDIDGASGNPLVCVECDTPDLIDKWKEMHKQAKEKFWWFTRE